MLQQVKQARADQAREEGDEARVVHEVRGLRGQQPLRFEGRNLEPDEERDADHEAEHRDRKRQVHTEDGVHEIAQVGK